MDENKGMKIIKLQAENVKRLRAVEIVPDKDGNLVLISGKNGAGKSSVLDSIMMALGGLATAPKKPIRDGAEKAKMMLDLGEMTVERSFTAAGLSYLHVKNKDGFEVGSPQKLLDKLVGRLSFDPLEFIQLEPDKQVRILKDITKLDFTMNEKERKEAYDNRTILNRELASLKDRQDRNQLEPGIPEEEVKFADITAEYQKALKQQQENQAKREELRELKVDLKTAIDAQAEIKGKIAELQKSLDETAKSEAAIRKQGKELTAQVDALVDPDLEAIQAKLDTAEALNAKIRARKERRAVDDQAKAVQGKINALEAKMTALYSEKEKALKEAKIPVPGLSFTESGLLYNGIPFEQLCSSEKLKISLAISIAINPQIRVILIRDGSLLDKANLATIQKMAEKYSVQVWLERVDDSGQVGVVIEDGMVKGKK